MKQALKAAGTAALGVAIAAVGAGSASAAPAPGGVGLPTTALTNPAVTNTVTDAATKLPGGEKVAGTLGTLAPTAGQAAPAAAPAEAPIAGVTNRAAVPNIPGVDKTPIGGLTNTLPLPGLTG
ncbi:ATP-binding protein [Kitasatospora sp. NPDC097643]|uniref:ATP-binding protein n=1 Tax=Kitasatospora sp. NPDC097643 TaxID=3157230 RepID=UPI0033330662